MFNIDRYRIILLVSVLRQIVFTIIKILVAIFIFFTIKFSFDIAGRLIRRSVGGSIAISFPDRIGGGLLGILKGFVIVAIMMFPLSLFRGGYERVTQGSIITPYLEKVFSVASQKSFSEKFLDILEKLLTLTQAKFTHVNSHRRLLLL